MTRKEIKTKLTITVAEVINWAAAAGMSRDDLIILLDKMNEMHVILERAGECDEA